MPASAAEKRKRSSPKKSPPLQIIKLASKADFDQVLTLINAARTRAIAAVNTTMIDLYWKIGEFISHKVANDAWGQGTVDALAAYIRRRQPNARGFSGSNLRRMRQFFETYRTMPICATLLRKLPWSHNLAILSRCKIPEEQEFYLKMATQERWSIRDLQRQLDGALFERVVLSPAKLSPAVRVLHPDAATVFKDAYLVEFLNLTKNHQEKDLHHGLVQRLKDFLIELGRDFCFVGSYYPLQVGTKDFELDLLFFHRGLSCLIAIELKIEEFQPEHMGKLEFYLEALDRDVKKPHENPSIGVLLCATKNQEVVEYALSRTISPAVVAEYKTLLPDKHMLQTKLHEFYEQAKEFAKLPPTSVSKVKASSKNQGRRRKK